MVQSFWMAAIGCLLRVCLSRVRAGFAGDVDTTLPAWPMAQVLGLGAAMPVTWVIVAAVITDLQVEVPLTEALGTMSQVLFLDPQFTEIHRLFL